ncbi:MAG: hypothetical protein ABR593_08330 [Candidatus Limnocylindria bacterium]
MPGTVRARLHDGLPYNGYFRAKVAQEKSITESGISEPPFSTIA